MAVKPKTHETPSPRRPAEPRSRSLRDDAEDILGHLRALRREFVRNPFADAERSGLTVPQMIVMARLVNGPRALTDLSQELGMSHSTASGIVDRLEARGLVRRAPDAADGRRTLIGVTGKVVRYTTQLMTSPASRIEEALAHATPRQRALIRQGLAMLRQLLRA